MLLGTTGSASEVFAGRLDNLFAITATVARQSAAAAQVPGAALAGLTARPGDILWLASLLLLLGTAGVLIVARIALAATLAIGPVFVVLALFRPTRDLFSGWLRVAIQMALAPLLAVLLGSALLQLIQPLIAGLVASGGKVTLAQATAMFVAAFVHVALMTLALRASGGLTGALRLPGSGDGAVGENLVSELRTALLSPPAAAALATARGEATGGAMPAATLDTDRRTRVIASAAMLELQPLATGSVSTAPDPRLRPLGQRFRAARRD